jgi:hypothetical protein
MFRTFIGSKLLLAALLCVGATSVMAGTVCTTYDPAGGTGLFRENMSLNAAISDDCYGHSAVGANSVAEVRDFANNLTLFGSNDWSSGARINAGAAPGAESYELGGLRFTLSGLTNTGDDIWDFVLQVSDTNGGASLNLPATVDLIGAIKGSTGTDFFWFNDETVSADNNGTLKMSLLNKKGNNVVGLSDITFLVRDGRDTQNCPPGDPTCTPTRIPEPGSMALVGLGLLLASYSRRRPS